MGDWSFISYGLIAFVGVVAFLRLVANEIHAKCAAIDQRREQIEDDKRVQQHRQEQQAAAGQQAATYGADGADAQSSPAP